MTITLQISPFHFYNHMCGKGNSFHYSSPHAPLIIKCFHPFKFSNKEVQCCFYQAGGKQAPMIYCNEFITDKFTEMYHYLESENALTFAAWDPEVLDNLAIMANFICGGDEYIYIKHDKLESFKEEYRNRCLDEKCGLIDNPFASTYEVKLDFLEPPQLTDEALIFFVHKDYIIYKASVFLKNHENGNKADYALVQVDDFT